MMPLCHGGRRRGAGRPPGRLEELFEVYKAIEEWRSKGKRRRPSVREACQQIADRGGLRWVDMNTGQVLGRITSATNIRNRYMKAVAEIVRPAKSRGYTLTGVWGARLTPKTTKDDSGFRVRFIGPTWGDS